MGIHQAVTLPETNKQFAPENRVGPKRKLVFQPSIFRCELLVIVFSVFFGMVTFYVMEFNAVHRWNLFKLDWHSVFSLGIEVEAINSQLQMHDAKKLTWNI